jgi:signal peptidase I
MDDSGWQEGSGPAAADGAVIHEGASPDGGQTDGGQSVDGLAGSGSGGGPAVGGLGASEPDGAGADGSGAGQAGGSGQTGTAQQASGRAPSEQTGAGRASSGGEKTGARKSGRKRRSFWRELPVLIVVALVLALVIKTYALQAFFIPSGSMENTLNVYDRVLINKLVYDFRDIHRGDVIVFNGAGSWDPELAAPSSNPVTRFFTNIGQMIGIVHGEDDYVKRVIGLPGDHVACCNAAGQVTVNGVALSESSYLFPQNAPSLTRFSITVPAGRLWVMGDHREISYDSRGHTGDPGGGTIAESSVLGRVFVRIWPPSRWGFLPIPATFQQPKLNASLARVVDSGTAQAAVAAPELPLVLGLAGAVPLTLLQRGLRRPIRTALRRRRRRSGS